MNDIYIFDGYQMSWWPARKIPLEGRTYDAPMMAFSGRALRAVKGRSGGDCAGPSTAAMQRTTQATKMETKWQI